MRLIDSSTGACCRGFSMVEVLVTLVVLAFGLLGLVNLQIKLQMNEVESYQRGQALVLLEDMASRIRIHALTRDDVAPADGTADAVARLASYDTGNAWLGKGSAVDCGATPPVDALERDRWDWDCMLKGAAIEGGTPGAMQDARGCITQINAGDPNDGFCVPAQYRITVTWQGLFESATPQDACAANQYGSEGFRRSISTFVTIGTPRCLPS